MVWDLPKIDFGEKKKLKKLKKQQGKAKTEIFLKKYTPEMTMMKVGPKITASPMTVREMCNAYGMNLVSLSGLKKSVSIAIVIAYNYPFYKKDLATYCDKFNVSKQWINKVNVVSMAKNIQTNNDWGLEGCLDLQTIYTSCVVMGIMAYVTINIIQAKSASIGDMNSAVQFASKNNCVVSMSWGANEFSTINSYNSYYANSQCCYCASSGDDNFVSFPATMTNIMSVGGSTLYLNSDKTVNSESTWQSAGSGISQYVAKPNYQQNTQNPSSYRLNPDICANANPSSGVYICQGKNTFAVGGTSLSCPMWAGFIGAVQLSRINKNKGYLTTVENKTNNLQKKMYDILGTQHYATVFSDILIGRDGNYSAKINYDLATGIGSPKCNDLFKFLID